MAVTQPAASLRFFRLGRHQADPRSWYCADGIVLEGWLWRVSHAVGEVCFNTAMTGYEEILTDPSYARADPSPSPSRISASRPPTRTTSERLSTWRRPPARVGSCCTPQLRSRRTIAPPAISTMAQGARQSSGSRASTRARSPASSRAGRMPNALIAHEPSGSFDLAALKAEAWHGPAWSPWTWCRW